MARINVLVVDDSVVIRRLVTTSLESDPEISVCGTAANGRIALSKLLQVAPDLVTLDVEMPELNGLETLRELRKTHPRLPVIMFSTLTERGAAATLDALTAGASDYVCKPANVGSVPEAIAAVREQLIPKIKALVPGGIRPLPSAPPRPQRHVPVQPVSSAAPTGRVDLLAIGSSTGGPDALTEVLPRLPANLAVPVVITQHMPPVFTRLFAQRLDAKCPLSVKEAEDGDRLEAGRVLVAPGDRHLVLERRGTATVVRLSDAPAENFCRPAVDVMFRSAAALYGDKVLAVVLTGMGSDGARGAEVLRAAGSEVVVQDQASSVVWGMPGAVVAAGQAHRVLPLRDVATDVLQVLVRGRSGARPDSLSGAAR
ncbi:MAG: putative response regulator receiver modulated methylesterase CheB [Frankiales bacterium]|nr:putative response regulator receiver modulated methylesterase CheB [Frankiales bacterium]